MSVQPLTDAQLQTLNDLSKGPQTVGTTVDGWRKFNGRAAMSLAKRGLAKRKVRKHEQMAFTPTYVSYTSKWVSVYFITDEGRAHLAEVERKDRAREEGGT